MMKWLKPEWSVAGNIHAVTTLRSGGVSEGHFCGLNLALHVQDEVAHVLQNRLILSDVLNLPASPVWLQQVHGNRVIDAAQATGVELADASYSWQQGVVCAVLTADCLPILLATENGQGVAAIHAGWRGLLAGVIEQTVQALGTKKLVAWLGPAIGAECFEVGEDVLAAFRQKSVLYAEAFHQQPNSKYLADIYQLARIELHQLGITNTYGGSFCTVTEKRFYSYRRDGETGRMATLIWRD